MNVNNRFFPVFLLAFLVSANGIAQTYTYVNTLGWDNPNSWSPVGVPPNPLTSGEVIIDGLCLLNSSKTIGSGASLRINPGKIFLPNGDLTIEGSLINQGLYSMQLGNLTVPGSLQNDPSGSFTQSGGTVSISGTFQNEGAFLISAGTTNILHGGTMTNDSLVINQGTFNNYGQITNNRTFQLSGGAFNNGDSSGDRFYNNGPFRYLGGSFSNNHIDYFDNSGGVFEGSGTITGDLKNAAGGTVSPNGLNGLLTITGNFINEGTLEMDVINTPQNDQIAVQGSATLNGTLTVTVHDALSSNPSFTLIDANSFTGNFNGGPSLPNPSYWTIDDAAPDYVLTYNGPPLPIRLLDFQGEPSGNAILLRWTTASESDNAFVEVQRSRDGVRFEVLGTVPGTGPSDTPRHYQFADKAPFPGLNYYRLRQVDFNGAETFFPVLAVVFSGLAGALQINPNVVSEVLNVQLPAPLAGPGELLVIDLLGRTVCKNSVTFGDQTIHLEVGSLPQGSYWLALRSGGSISVSRFVVQR
ncbi:MAG: hypothetical protein IPH16_12825 [Haliscomenobacter sp.]|nr:hypothetical protein [Haliscomenobacter sp.]